MAKRGRFRVVVVLLVAIPLVALCMLLALERSYADEINSRADRELEAHRNNFVLPERWDGAESKEDIGGRDSDKPLRQRAPLVEDMKDRDMQSRKDNKLSRLTSRRGNQPSRKPSNINPLSNRDSLLKPQHTSTSQQTRPNIDLLKTRKTYELRLDVSIRELWWYTRGQVKSGGDPHKLESLKNQYDVLRFNLDDMTSVGDWGQKEVGGNPYQPNWHYWQKNISQDMTSLMERRIHHLQNPPNCANARKLVCHLAKTCGFGCQMHHVAYCFIMAYATERTLILDSTNWRYAAEGWSAVFLPLSESCVEARGHSVGWSSRDDAASIVDLPPIDNFPSPRPSQLPMSIPRDLSDRLLAFHGFPFAWFIGQFLKFMLRPSAHLESYLTEKRRNLGVEHPIVGVHIRRTDKKMEAQYHQVQEYMEQVDAWFDYYELRHSGQKVTRRVYIATDDPNVLSEAKEKYPRYTIHSDSQISSLASKTSTRYSMDSLYGVAFDVLTLSHCDYLVCTFSSQICRLAYELMQTHHVDASRSFYSLDDIYYFGGQLGHDVRAFMEHTAHVKEINFAKNDLIGIAGNERTGYGVGAVHRPSAPRGLFPVYKTEEDFMIADFPTYPNVQ